MNQQAEDLRRCCDALEVDNKRLREAVQGLLDALPSATAHPAIVAAKAAIAGQPQPTSHDCELPDGLIPASPNLEYLRSMTGNQNLPAYMRGQIMAAVRRLAQPSVQAQQDVHWYAVDRHGLATLCASEEDARDTAAEADQCYPHNAPHIATQLAPIHHQAQQDAEDAARYRWLRENADSVRGEYTEEIFYRMDVRTGVLWASATIHNALLPSIDAAIDAARKEQS